MTCAEKGGREADRGAQGVYESLGGSLKGLQPWGHEGVVRDLGNVRVCWTCEAPT
jgi:hypothetical protein